MDRVADKWSLLLITILEQSPKDRLRFSELKNTIPGISQRMLTITLRNLERDGVLSRHFYPEIPPRVEYELTPLGKSLMVPIRELVGWIKENWDDIQQARKSFDKSGKTSR
jgi:DNA-binding HxlR family transcriptional regulator